MKRSSRPTDSDPGMNTFLTVRGLRYHLRRWGTPGGRPLLLLHGVRDCSASFQFVVESLQQKRDIIAPDWRGHGLSDHAPQTYWLHEFLADLDDMLEQVCADVAPDVLAHSMGGNIAYLHCALRPGRIRRLVALDALGARASFLPVDIVAQLDTLLKASPRRQTESKAYSSLGQVAERLMAENPRLTPARATFLAGHCTSLGLDGHYRWLFDPAIRSSYQSLHTREEWAAIWQRIDTPILWIGSSANAPEQAFFDDETLSDRRGYLRRAHFMRLSGAGHNLHHDRPEEIARLTEAFLTSEQEVDPLASRG